MLDRNEVELDREVYARKKWFGPPFGKRMPMMDRVSSRTRKRITSHPLPSRFTAILGVNLCWMFFFSRLHFLLQRATQTTFLVRTLPWKESE